MATSTDETTNTSTRITRGGRTLTYQVKVIQQPQRARACGAGAKSSADRRPVDPPPVVELRIFEGENQKDVTAAYNASFFLYATLDHARPVAQGRMPNATIPVLTGTPVSGMAYLDRPSPAGYFIFPDLSVRHEGRYKLIFYLFEETKEAMDETAEVSPTHPMHANNSPSSPHRLIPRQFVHMRVEVESLPFTVFSAKKFPGLAESTTLSRIVAEQGCRVRIRRDVRMRRRENKGNKDMDEFEEDGYMQNRQSSTPGLYEHNVGPHADAERQRSGSNASVEQSPYGMEHRQSFGHPQQPPQYPPAGLPTQNGTGHLSFGAQPYQYQQPQGQPMPPPAQAYGISPMSGSPSDRHYSYSYDRTNSAPYSGQITPQSARSDAPSDFRRDSFNNFTFPAQPPNNFPTYSNNLGNRQYSIPSAYPMHRASTPVDNQSLPPLSIKPLEPTAEGPMAVTMSSPSFQQSAGSELSRGKRSFNSAFTAAHHDQSLTNGMRPSEIYHGAEPTVDESYEDDSDDAAHFLKMSYKRADGSCRVAATFLGGRTMS